MVFDFHTHTFLIDGVLSPAELIRRAYVQGYKAIAITDHVGLWDQERIIPILVKECAAISQELGIVAVPGVEITHVPKGMIDEAARRAKELGAKLVVVHGETMVEPVEKGTNLAALLSSHVNILAHPGILSHEEAKLSAQRGVFLEISARKGHSLANGLVARLATSLGAPLILDSDAHEPQDLLTNQQTHNISLGAGLSEAQIKTLLTENPLALLKGLRVSPTDLS